MRMLASTNKKVVQQIMFMISLALLTSCSQQNHSSSDSGSVQQAINSLENKLFQLQADNSNLLVSVKAQQLSNDKLNAIVKDQETKIANLQDTATWQTNSLINLATYFDGQLARHQASISNLAVQYFWLSLNQSDNSEIVLNANEQSGFVRINSTSGFFLISVKDVQPYLDGYKLMLNVGNPLSATYKNLKLNVAWGKKFDPNNLNQTNSYQTWTNQLQHKELSMPEDLLPGSWNKIALILSPAKADELSYISLKMDTETVSLRTPTGNSP